MTNTTVQSAPAVADEPQLYRISALFYGFLRMWRGWKIVLPVLLANALIQSLLTLIPVGDGFSAGFMATVVVSAFVLVVAGAVLTAACLDAVSGPVTASSVRAHLQSNLGRFAITIVALAVVVMIGLGIYTWPGLLIAALLPFVTLAAMDGTSNPIAANFRVIAARPFRWLITMLTIGGIALIMWVLMAVNGFFVPSWVGAFVACLVGGLLVWWWQTSLALIYRSSRKVPSDSP